MVERSRREVRGERKILYAYESDGSWIGAGQRMPGTFVVHSIFSAQDQSYTELHHDVNAKTTMYGQSALPTAPEDPSCEAIHESLYSTQTVIGKDIFLGFPVVKRMTQHLDDGDTYESWQAPDLECRAIFVRDTRRNLAPGVLKSMSPSSNRAMLLTFPGRVSYF